MHVSEASSIRGCSELQKVLGQFSWVLRPGISYTGLGSAREGNGSAQSRNVVVYHPASSACKAVQMPSLSPFCNCGMSDTCREVILLRPEHVLSQLVSWKSQHMYKRVHVNGAREDVSHFTLPVSSPPRCLTARTSREMIQRTLLMTNDLSGTMPHYDIRSKSHSERKLRSGT